MPIADPSTGQAARPEVPKSLMLLLPSIFALLFLGILSIVFYAFGDGIGTTMQGLIFAAFLLTAVSAIMFWRDLPNFKLSLQAFVQSQKRWKCRECQHEWQR